MVRLVAILMMCSILLTGCEFSQLSEFPVEEEMYRVMNEIIEDNTLYMHALCVQPLEPLDLVNKEWSNEFDTEDLAFIKRCQDALIGIEFRPGALQQWDSRQHDWVPIELVPSDDSTFYKEISWPLIDAKREKALVHFMENANGFLSGSGRKVLYVKVRGRWKWWKVYDPWIS